MALVVSGAPGAQAAAAGEVAPYQAEILRQAPTLTTTTTGQEDPGYLLTTPGVGMGSNGGAAIYDNSGELVWFSEGNYSNLKEITFQGEPALAMLRGGGQAVVLDSSYTEVASFGMDGYDADFHALAFNEDGSRALLAAYNPVSYDLSPWGGPADAQVVDAVVQEVDTQTGEVTFEWHGLDHIPVDETNQPLTEEGVDYLHANSLAYDSDGNILMSARHTSAVYKIDIATGDIIWRFGGENSDFTFADPAAMPSYQHDATRLPDGRLAVFDNGVGRSPQASRGAVWEIDEQAMTADLVLDLQPQEPVFAEVTGSSQPTTNGNQLVNFGNTGRLVEFSGSEPVFTATFASTSTYKAERSTDWVGTPATAPDVAWTEAAGDGSRDLYMSWNGATEVDAWRIEARDADADADADAAGGGSFETVATVDRTGFETGAEVAVPQDADILRVSALDDAGHVLSARTLTDGVTATIGE
ncbi:arylsulfotransferase family protein [Streptomyces sp. 6N223]|uniref:arylsulfotransferase family protein n=1 Tax=Streptomyces sp. 6N223 TaxID=3457412 RepID=UPI003FD4396F